MQLNELWTQPTIYHKHAASSEIKRGRIGRRGLGDRYKGTQMVGNRSHISRHSRRVGFKGRDVSDAVVVAGMRQHQGCVIAAVLDEVSRFETPHLPIKASKIGPVGSEGVSRSLGIEVRERGNNATSCKIVLSHRIGDVTEPRVRQSSHSA